MADQRNELIERREALRSLDWRLSAVSADIEHIIESGNEVRTASRSVTVQTNAGTQEEEGRIREELIEIAAHLRRLSSSREVPEVDEAAGWSVTMEYRVPELRELAARMQTLVREAFAEVEAQLPSDVPSAPLGDLDPHEGEVPGDRRKHRMKLLQAAFTVFVLGLIFWGAFVDMDALRRACEHPSACPSHDKHIAVLPGGWIIVHQLGADCVEIVRLHFDRKGESPKEVEPNSEEAKRRPARDVRASAACSEVESLRWTWVMTSKRRNHYR